jgi:hypothetical protein
MNRNDFILCQHDWIAWESRLKEPAWELKKVIRWISNPLEWGTTCFLTKFIPEDMNAYKRKLYEEALDGIKEGKLKPVFNGDGHHIFPLQLLIFYHSKRYYLPLACRSFLDDKRTEEFAKSVGNIVKRKKLEPSASSKGDNTRRSDQVQMESFLKTIIDSINQKPPKNYKELFGRPEIEAILNAFTYSDGSKPKILDPAYLKRKISPFMPDRMKKPSRK